MEITDKDAHFAEVILMVIENCEHPMLLYEGEKEAVRKGLRMLLDEYEKHIANSNL